MPEVVSKNRCTRGDLLGHARALLAAGPAPTAGDVAAAAGLSRSTYYRLAGGSHEELMREAGWVGKATARQRLIDATAELLEEVGIAGLLMDDVAERAGVSRATLYRIFPGKPELLGALTATRAPLGSLGAVLATMADRSPEEVLPGLIAAVTPRLLANRGVLRAMFAEAAAHQDAPARAVVSGLYAELASYLEGQMAAGRLRRTDPLAALQALIGPLLAYALIRPDFWGDVVGELAPPQDTIDELVHIWLRGMQP